MKLIHAGKRLQELQSDLGISSAELSRKTGISPQQMLRYRTQKNMKLHTMQILCEALGIEPAIFIAK